MKYFNVIIYICLLSLFTGCSFKVLDQTKLKNYKILEITEDGDKKTNFFIKNELYNLLNVDDSANGLIISIKTEKVKSIKGDLKHHQQIFFLLSGFSFGLRYS